MIYLQFLLFILSLSMAGAVIVILFRKKLLKNDPAYKYLLYAGILFYTWGLYGMWGTLFFNQLVVPEVEFEIFARITNYITFLGLPFLLLALGFFTSWLILLRNARLSLKQAVPVPAAAVVIAVVISLFAGPASLLDIQRLGALGLFSVFGFACATFLAGPLSAIGGKHRWLTALFCLLTALVQVPVLTGWRYLPLAESLRIFCFFGFISACLYIFVSKAKGPTMAGGDEPGNWTDFSTRYHITGREMQVVMEIYMGKTNQEIADTLFLSLQTVKDHTSRIYQKTMVKNRGQLTSLLRQYSKG